MQTKYLLLCCFTFSLGIGTAFTPPFVHGVWVRAKKSPLELNFHCYDTGEQCVNSGNVLCLVQITVSGTPVTVQKTYRAGCAYILRNTSAFTATSELEVYDLEP